MLRHFASVDKGFTQNIVPTSFDKRLDSAPLNREPSFLSVPSVIVGYEVYLIYFEASLKKTRVMGDLGNFLSNCEG